MIVYRVERDCEEGPYGDPPYKDDVDMGYAHTRNLNTPSPMCDGIGWKELSGDHYFGFSTRARLDRWFEGWAEALHRAEFVASVYEVSVEHVVFGVLQLAFLRDKATWLREEPLVREEALV